MTDREAASPREITRSIGRNIEPFLLVELLRGPSYGYDLIRRLGEYGFRRAVAEPGVIYKVLRALEDAGHIQSSWATRESGAPRRYYEITESGRVAARERVYYMKRFLDRVTLLMANYTELTDDDLPVDPRLEQANEPEAAGTTAKVEV